MGRHGWLGALAATAAMAMAGGASADEMTTTRGPATRSGAIHDASIVPPLRVAWDVTLQPDPWSAVYPPLIAGGLVYVELGSDLIALDAATGAERWRRSVRFTAPLTYDRGRLFAVTDYDQDVLTAYDAATGLQLWSDTYPDGVVQYSAPTAGDGRVYAVAPNAVRAFDGATGRVLWETPTAGPQAILGTPSTDGARVYVPAADGQIAEYDAATGAQLTTPPAPTANSRGAGGSTAVAGDRVYMNDYNNSNWVLDRASGTRLGLAGGSSEPAVGSGVLVDRFNELKLHAESATTGLSGWDVTRGGADGSGPWFTNPLIAQRTAYTATDDGRLVGLALADGHLAFCARLEQGTSWGGSRVPSVAAGDGIVLWVSNSRLVAFRHVDGAGEDCLDGLPDARWSNGATLPVIDDGPVAPPAVVVPPADAAPAAPPPAADAAPAAPPPAAVTPPVRLAAQSGPVARTATAAAKVTPPCTATRAGRLTCTLGLAARTSVTGVLRKGTKVVGRATARADRRGRVALAVRPRAKRLATGTYTLTITYKKSPHARTATQRRISLVVR
ncbi:PQQ-binding-like beta-propeller repeat protein [Conexibacter woesei]|uniref:outer membrane protein assembly factor BamB family protein n=1 Tax=Conexibacter woesei TaxID=191495 RepID=UPI000402B582|nr:PQQ-binding-like beta-propeller repeat protein [Conexibacter woesei]